MNKSRSYEKNLREALIDPVEAAEYLKAALEDGDPGVFLLALKDVAASNGGMAEVAKKAQLNRENLYRMLSASGNPRINSLNTLLHALGMKLSIEVESGEKASKVA